MYACIDILVVQATRRENGRSSLLSLKNELEFLHLSSRAELGTRHPLEVLFGGLAKAEAAHRHRHQMQAKQATVS